MTSRDPFENHSRISLGVNIRDIFLKRNNKGKKKGGREEERVSTRKTACEYVIQKI